MKLKEKEPPLPIVIQNFIKNIMPGWNGWMSAEKGNAIVRSILKSKPLYCVEIGVFAGRSLITIALALKENGQGICQAIDPWEASESVKGFESDKANSDWWQRDHSPFLKETQDHIREMKVEDFVALTVGTSEEALKRTIEVYGTDAPPMIDLLHIDGNHSIESALFDVNSWIPLVKPGCEVWLDDLNWLSTKQAQLRILDFCDLIEVISDCGVYRKRP